MESSYGIAFESQGLDSEQLKLEELLRKGFTALEGCLTPDEVAYASSQIEEIYMIQEASFGKEKMKSISELDMARAPLLYDRFFLEKIALNPKVLSIVEKVIEGAFQLHLQNGVINRSNTVHHQSNWHRDLPYQNWTSSKVLAISAFFCLCDFTKNNGATFFLPYSHLFDEAPSVDFLNGNKLQITAPRGSVLIFNSMVLHAAGNNSSGSTRIGINNMYTIPLIKQQIDIADSLSATYSDLSEQQKQILGIGFATPKSVDSWRASRYSKKKDK